MTKKGSEDFLSRKLDLKSTILIALVTFSLITAFADNINGFVFKSGSAYIDKGHYFSKSGESACDKVGGIPFVEKSQGKMMKGKLVKLHDVGVGASLISVNGAKRTLKPGHSFYVGGLFVTVFSTGTKDACLIVKDYQ